MVARQHSTGVAGEPSSFKRFLQPSYPAFILLPLPYPATNW